MTLSTFTYAYVASVYIYEFRYFTHFSWLVYLLLSFRSSLHILKVSYFSDMCSSNIFFQSVAFIFILLTVSCIEKTYLILMKSNLLTFHGLLFWCRIKKSLTKSKSPKFSSMLAFGIYF